MVRAAAAASCTSTTCPRPSTRTFWRFATRWRPCTRCDPTSPTTGSVSRRAGPTCRRSCRGSCSGRAVVVCVRLVRAGAHRASPPALAPLPHHRPGARRGVLRALLRGHRGGPSPLGGQRHRRRQGPGLRRAARLAARAAVVPAVARLGPLPRAGSHHVALPPRDGRPGLGRQLPHHARCEHVAGHGLDELPGNSISAATKLLLFLHVVLVAPIVELVGRRHPIEEPVGYVEGSRSSSAHVSRGPVVATTAWCCVCAAMTAPASSPAR